MDPWTLVGALAALCVALQWLPQLWHAGKTRRMRDVHWGLMLLGFAGAAFWVAYGWHLRDGIIIATNVFVGGCLLLLMLMKRSYEK